MMSITLIRLPHKQFGDMIKELMREKIDMVSHANQEWEKSDRVRQ